MQLAPWIMLADLLVWRPLQDFDRVLRMDRLAQYHATVDSGERTVTFLWAGQELTYGGCRSTLFAATVSSAKVKRMMSRGCIACLATVVEVPTAAPELKDIPIVCEFLDVIPPKLMTMPPNKELEFVINVVPEAALTPKAPYRMASAELRELKGQLQNLMDKGVVRPSVSPRGRHYCGGDDGSLGLLAKVGLQRRLPQRPWMCIDVV